MYSGDVKHRIYAGLLALALALGLPVSAIADLAIDSATNQVRAQAGLSALTTSAALTSVAAIRVQQIVTNFAHPTDWQWMFDAVPGCESLLGENIAYYTTGAEPAGWPVSAWVASPDHYANIVGDWNYQGSALYRASDGRTYAVQLFARSCSVPPGPAPQPPAGPPIVPEIPDTHM